MATVIDACCWRDYVDEWVAETEGEGTKLFAVAQANGGVFIDGGNLIKQEYISLKRPYAEQLYDIWFEEAWSSGGVKLVELSGKNSLRKELSALGLPSKDHLYFRVAIHGGATCVVSKDSDFFDPAKKKCGEQEKIKLVTSGKGPVCKYMNKTYSLTVCCPQKYLEAA